MLIVMCGLPRTGKSTLARKLAKRVEAKILRTDSIRREIFKSGSLEEVLSSKNPLEYDLQRVFNSLPRIPEEYQELIWKQNEIVYSELLKRTEDAIRRKENLILDGTFSKKSLRRRVYEIATKNKVNAYLIYCICDEDIIKKRIESKERDREDLSNVVTMDVYYKVKAAFEEPIDEEVTMIKYDSGRGEVVKIERKSCDFSELKTIMEAILEK